MADVTAPRAPGRAILALAAVVSTVFGAPAGSESLSEAWQLALANDALLMAARAEVDAAGEVLSAARGARWPTLTAGASYVRLDDAPAFEFPVGGTLFSSPELVNGDDFVVSNLQARMPIFTAGRVSSGISAAEKSQQAMLAHERRTVDQLKIDVAEAYVGALRAGRALAVADSNVASLDSYARDVASMFERELIPLNDLLAARVSLANSRQEQLRARNALEIALESYNRLLGQPLARKPVLEPEIAEARKRADEPLAVLITRALERRSELAVTGAQRAALEDQARMERAQVYPQFYLAAGYAYLENAVLDREDFAMVGLQFTWTAFDGGASRARAAGLRQRARAAGEVERDLRSAIELEVRRCWLELDEAVARIATAREAVQQAEENLRITREQYIGGLATTTRVLEAEALRSQAIRNSDDATLDRALAELRLRRATGDL
jgi:outer membrane protein TolC